MTGSLQESEKAKRWRSQSCGWRTGNSSHAAGEKITENQLQSENLHGVSLLRLVRLCIRVRLQKGGVLQGALFDLANARQGTQVDIETMRRVKLRQQVYIRNARSAAKTEIVAVDERLDRSQALANSVADPGVDLLLVMTQRPQTVKDSNVVQRMDIAADNRSHSPLPGTHDQVRRQQRRLRITFFKVLDDGGRLSDDLPAIEPEHRHPALRIDRKICRFELLAAVTNQIDRYRRVRQPFEGQRNAHAVAGRRAVISE